MAVLFIEDLCVLWVESGFNRGKGGIGVFRCGEMLVKDRAVFEEACDVRHAVGVACACHIPRQCIEQNVQHEFFSCTAVPETDRCTNSIRGVFTGV